MIASSSQSVLRIRLKADFRYTFLMGVTRLGTIQPTGEVKSTTEQHVRVDSVVGKVLSAIPWICENSYAADPS